MEFFVDFVVGFSFFSPHITGLLYADNLFESSFFNRLMRTLTSSKITPGEVSNCDCTQLYRKCCCLRHPPVFSIFFPSARIPGLHRPAVFPCLHNWVTDEGKANPERLLIFMTVPRVSLAAGWWLQGWVYADILRTSRSLPAVRAGWSPAPAVSSFSQVSFLLPKEEEFSFSFTFLFIFFDIALLSCVHFGTMYHLPRDCSKD